MLRFNNVLALTALSSQEAAEMERLKVDFDKGGVNVIARFRTGAFLATWIWRLLLLGLVGWQGQHGTAPMTIDAIVDKVAAKVVEKVQAQQPPATQNVVVPTPPVRPEVKPIKRRPRTTSQIPADIITINRLPVLSSMRPLELLPSGRTP